MEILNNNWHNLRCLSAGARVFFRLRVDARGWVRGCLLALVVLAPVVRADEIFEALLLPGNEVPPHASGAQGFVKIDLHSDLTLNVTQQTIGMPPSDGLLQCCGGPGTIQPVALSLGAAIGTDTFNLTTRLAPSFIALHGGTAALAAADLVAAMESGNTYVNVPDDAFRRGEIRGQLLLIPDITEPGTLTVLHGFGGIDGRSPSTGLIRDHEGNLYGTTYGFPFGSVPGNCGTVFKIDKSGNQTILHRFDGTDGANPRLGHLIHDEEGNLYGTTSTGGTVPGGNPGAASGTVFRLDVRGNLTTLYTFSGLFDGGSPSGTLVRNEAGEIFGTTSGGGTQGYGTVFKLDRRGQESVLHSFQAGGGGGGIQPQQGLVADRQGNLYGVTLPGGGPDDHGGNVFRITPAGTETTLYTFSGGADGGVPSAPLLFDEGGNLYGTTQLGGTNNLGTVFELDLSGKETVLHSFAGGLQNDGANPAAGLVRDEAGNFYGTTWAGGLRSSFGSVFKMDATGRITILYSFLPNNGDSPSAGVVRDDEGNLYGVTIPNPLFPLGFGAVFKLTPKGPPESEEPAEPSSSPREGGSDP